MQTFKQHNSIITSIHNTLDVNIDSFFTKKIKINLNYH